MHGTTVRKKKLKTRFFDVSPPKQTNFEKREKILNKISDQWKVEFENSVVNLLLFSSLQG